MKAWFNISELQRHVGIITDYFINYIELKDIETGKYYVVHEDKVEFIKEIMEYKVEGLNKLSEQLHKFQIDAGFTDSNIVQRLMLVHSEISEAFEAYRNDKYADLNSYKECEKATDILPEDMPVYIKQSFEALIKDTLQDEIADSVIRLLAFCGENNIDIEKHIQFKMKYNKLRGFKYGDKKF